METLLKTTFDYSAAMEARSYLGDSTIGVFDGENLQNPGIYHVGDMVQGATSSGQIPFTQALGRMWTAVALAEAISGAPADERLTRRLYALGENAGDMYSAYLS